MSLHACQLDDARLLLRWAAQSLTASERAALSAFALDLSGHQAVAYTGVSRAALWQAQRRAFPKMRQRLEQARVRCVADVLG